MRTHLDAYKRLTVHWTTNAFIDDTITSFTTSLIKSGGVFVESKNRNYLENHLSTAFECAWSMKLKVRITIYFLQCRTQKLFKQDFMNEWVSDKTISTYSHGSFPIATNGIAYVNLRISRSFWWCHSTQKRKASMSELTKNKLLKVTLRFQSTITFLCRSRIDIDSKCQKCLKRLEMPAESWK